MTEGGRRLREHGQRGFFRQGAEERHLRRHRLLEDSREQLCWVAARCG